jgi:hypothetical protein
MSTSRVSKYNNHNDNVIIAISISNFSNSTPYILRDDCNDKLSLITECVTTTWTDIHHARKRTWPTQHTIDSQMLSRMTSRGSHGDSNWYTPFKGRNLINTPYAWLPEALTYFIKISPLSMGEVLALGLIPPPTTSLRQGVRFDKVVTGLLVLPGPIKPDVRSVQNSRLAIRIKMMRSLTDTDGAYHVETSK